MCIRRVARSSQPWAEEPNPVYYPGDSPAGEVEIGGKKVPRSYGSMSYAGLLSLLHADVKKDDARIVAALEWLQKHFNVEQTRAWGRKGSTTAISSCQRR